MELHSIKQVLCLCLLSHEDCWLPSANSIGYCHHYPHSCFFCKMIGSTSCLISSHKAFAVKSRIGCLSLVGTPRAHTHKTTQNTTRLSIAPTPVHLTAPFVGHRRKEKTLFRFADRDVLPPESPGSKITNRAKLGVLWKGGNGGQTTPYPTWSIQSKQGQGIEMPVTATASPQGVNASVSATATATHLGRCAY